MTRPRSRVITDAGAPPEPMTGQRSGSPRTAYRSREHACVAGRVVTSVGSKHAKGGQRPWWDDREMEAGDGRVGIWIDAKNIMRVFRIYCS